MSMCSAVTSVTPLSFGMVLPLILASLIISLRICTRFFVAGAPQNNRQGRLEGRFRHIFFDGLRGGTSCGGLLFWLERKEEEKRRAEGM
jgi:hypothetical protein